MMHLCGNMETLQTHHKGETMNREQMEDAIYAKTKLDMDMIESLTDSQLREMLGLNDSVETVEPKPTIKRGRPLRKRSIAVERSGFEYVEHEGKLHRLEHFTFGSSVRVACGDRVQFEGRTVSASIVLHWLRTGEIVKRVPRVRKIKAAIRFGDRVIHLGRFVTVEDAEAAKIAAKFRISLGLSPIG